MISIENRPLHELVKEIDPYVRSGEINSRVKSVQEKIDAVKVAFADGAHDMIDGLTVTCDTFWFNLRPTHTEPLLRLNIEADTPAILENVREKLLRIIRA